MVWAHILMEDINTLTYPRDATLMIQLNILVLYWAFSSKLLFSIPVYSNN